MKFVPVPGTEVLFCIWETRVQDYTAYAQANSGVDGSWRKVEYQGVPVSDGPDHPVTMVSWEDAKSFCDWLTRKEQGAGKLTAGQYYRLPTDLEWSAAVGLPRESGATPEERDKKVQDVWPWGTQWPPPNRAGNYADDSMRARFSDLETIPGYRDGYATTAPVGSFTPNRHGLYDLGGNVREWCEDWYDNDRKYRVLRGGSWNYRGRAYLLSSYRYSITPGDRLGDCGFRCVVVLGSSR